jgi:aromatic ring-cleaving dioxygenase
VVLAAGEYEARLKELESERQMVEEDRQQVRVWVGKSKRVNKRILPKHKQAAGG